MSDELMMNTAQTAQPSASAQDERECMSDHAPLPRDVPYPPSKDMVAIHNSYGPMSLEPHEGEPVEHLYGLYELRDYGARCIAWDRATRPAQTEQQPAQVVSEALTELLWAVRMRDEEVKLHGSGAVYWNNAVFACQVAIRDALAAPITQTPADGTNYKLKFENLVEHAKRQDKVIADMRYDENIRRYYDTGEVWFWAGDGTDNLDTLACPVVINAGDLRALIDGRSADGMVEALEEIVKRYPDPNISHVDFRVHACRHAEHALAAHRAGGSKA